jgi:hypothetical protein
MFLFLSLYVSFLVSFFLSHSQSLSHTHTHTYTDTQARLKAGLATLVTADQKQTRMQLQVEQQKKGLTDAKQQQVKTNSELKA